MSSDQGRQGFVSLGSQPLADLEHLLPVFWVFPAPAGTLQPFWCRGMADIPLSCLSRCRAPMASSWEVVWCVASTLCERSCRSLENFSICSMTPFRDLQRGVRGGAALWDTLHLTVTETGMHGGPGQPCPEHLWIIAEPREDVAAA